MTVLSNYLGGCDQRDRNAFIKVTTNGVYLGRCEDTGLPQYSDSTDLYIPVWLEFIADRANQSIKRAVADERIVELRGTLYEPDVQDVGALNNLFDAGLKDIWFKSVGWAGKWITMNAEVQSLGTSHLGIVQRYLGTPIVVHGRSQFVTVDSDLLPDEIKAIQASFRVP